VGVVKKKRETRRVQRFVKNVGHLVLKVLSGHYDANANVKKGELKMKVTDREG
jgi:hypothetical protein